MPRLTARFFGFPVIELDGAPAEFERRKTVALLAYLLASGSSAGRGPAEFGRESLAALFWPEMSQAKALSSLRHARWEINHTLGEGWIDKDSQAVRALPHPEDRVDILDFQALVEKGKRASLPDPYGQILVFLEAVALYRGDFLAGFTLRDTPEFDHWQIATADQYRSQFAGILNSLTDTYTQVGEYDAAIACARRWLGLDPLNEQAHRALMLCYDRAGQRYAALRQYDECVRILKKELGAIPEPATRTVYERILAGKSASAPALPVSPVAQMQTAVWPSAREETRPAALPTAAIPFIGRQAELKKIFELLAKPECRLLSLIGPGGIGKTRIVLQAAQSFLIDPAAKSDHTVSKSSYPDGIFFASLVDAVSQAAMLKMIANTVGCPFREEMETPAGIADNRLRLMHFLSVKRCLLILDNLEHLVDGANLVAEMYQAAPAIKILATSRHRLNLSQEWVVELSGMPVPGYREKEGIQDYSSVQLFVQNAARASGDFHPEAQDWPAIGRICQLVDGMPLGIELAAAWVRMFSCHEIAAEIERNLDFLYSSAQGVPERHQSLRAVFDYSWSLLSERERSAIRRLSVFRGGFSREMAARVAGADLALLTALVDHCLVRRSSSGRYELHEVLKKYGREKLASERREEDESLDFHSEMYLNFLVETSEQLKGAGQEQALKILDVDLENILLAWERAVEFGRIRLLLPALPGLVLYFETSNQWGRGREVFSQAMTRFELSIQAWLRRLRKREQLDPAGQEEVSFLAVLMASWKHFCQAGGAPGEPVRQRIQEILELAGFLPDCREKAYCLILFNIGPEGISTKQAQDLCRDCIRIFKEQEDTWGQAIAWLILGDLKNIGEGNNSGAREAYRTSLERFIALGNEWGKAVCYNGLGMVAFRDGNLREARSLWSESVAVFQRVNNVWREFESRYHLAEACEKDGDFKDAARQYQENAAILEKLGDKRSMAWQLVHQARMELASGEIEQARLHHQQAIEIFHQAGDLESAKKSITFSTLRKPIYPGGSK